MLVSLDTLEEPVIMVGDTNGFKSVFAYDTRCNRRQRPIILHVCNVRSQFIQRSNISQIPYLVSARLSL